MKRTPGVALWATLAALCALLGPARPAAAVPPPNVVPNFVRPTLFEGFEPIEPDEFGLSPNFEYFVFQDQDGLHVIRLFDGVETFTLGGVQSLLTVGFDPADERLFILEPLPGGNYRFRLADPETGNLLRSDFLTYFPHIRTNFEGTVTVILEPLARQTRVLVIDGLGLIVYRRAYSSLVQVALNAFFPAVAFLDPLSGGRIRVEVLNALRGVLVFRETVAALSIVGFSPFGASFVVARPISLNSFRVRLVDVFNARLLLSRSFPGYVNVGFTPEGTLLGVVARRGILEELQLYRTLDGRQIFLR